MPLELATERVERWVCIESKVATSVNLVFTLTHTRVHDMYVVCHHEHMTCNKYIMYKLVR